LAFDVMDKKNPGIHNQSIMDFGATVCKPLPLCEICPLTSQCVAYLQGFQLEVPVKEKKIIKKSRWLYYLVVNYKNQFYVRKREHRDIWQNLYEFILLEQSKPFSIKQLLASQNFKSIFKGTKYIICSASQEYKQQLTHQTINGQFINITVQTPLDINYYQLVSAEKLKELPFPKFITTYLKD